MGHIKIELDKLPDLQAVGGNRREAHWSQRYRADKKEKEEWIYLIRAAMTPDEMPHFLTATANVTLYFAEHRRRDGIDNIPRSLKGLWDALVHWDILVDDSSEFLTLGRLEVKVDKDKAPLTVIELEGEELGIPN